MSILFLLWVVLLLTFTLPQIGYFLYLKRISQVGWKLNLNKYYRPNVSIIIPFHNEEKIIGLKLKNLAKVNYPKGKMQIILVNDASSDNSLREIKRFLKKYKVFNDVKVLNIKNHFGKAYALNTGLKYAKYEIIVVSDADSFWSRDILVKALPYLSDPSIGAVMGRQVVFSTSNSAVIKGEEFYVNFANGILRLGESKLHSSVIFVGGFAAYKRRCLDRFDSEADDSGTSLNVVQKGYRSIFVPGAVYYEEFPKSPKLKFTIKVRRACNLIKVYVKCAKLLIRGELRLPMTIVFGGIFLYLISPIIFIALTITSLLLLFSQATTFLCIVISILITLILISKARLIFLEGLQSYLILASALLTYLSGKKFLIWKTHESRAITNMLFLKAKNLI
jgi:cellulose synthase/poly-beta-1,6-N-acetylglucosamine synthase-like glycosyltransferase